MLNFTMGTVAGAVVSPVLILLAAYFILLKVGKKHGLKPPYLPSHPIVSLDWAVQTSEGRDVNLAELSEGRITFLSFWSTTCFPCKAEMPGIESLYRKLGDRIVFACVSKDKAEVMLDFMQSNGYTVPAYHLAAEVTTDFKAPGIPATFVIGSDRRLMVKHIGSADWGHDSVVEFLEARLQDIANSTV